MKLTIKYGQSIFDIALIAYQDASRVYDLITGNSIENINSALTGITVEYTESTPLQNEIFVPQKSLIKPIIINFSQSVFDIAAQYYGAAENVFNFIKENGIENINSDPNGIILKYTVNNTYVPIYYRSISKNIATKVLLATPNNLTGNFRITDDNNFRITDDNNFRITD